MNDSIFRISLDIHEHGSQAVLKAKYADSGRSLHISLREGSIPYTIAEGCAAAFKATKPDGSHLFNECHIKDNEIVYAFTEQTCASVGTCRCEIVLYGSDGKVITSPRFLLLVDTQVYPDSVVESTSEFTNLTQLIVGTVNATNSANEAARTANAVAQDLLDSKNAGEFKGDKGDQGIQGEQGIQGIQGEKGDKGDKGDPGIVNIDDTKVGTDAWSSKNIVDKLCPSFELTGTFVTCEPVEGYPLEVNAPYASTIYRYGKNLFNQGVPWTEQSFYVNAEQRKRYGYSLKLPGGIYTINATPKPAASDYLYTYVNDADNSYKVDGYTKLSNGAQTITLAEGDTLYIVNGGALNAEQTTTLFGKYKVQVEAGNVATDHEEYHGSGEFNPGEVVPAFPGYNTILVDKGSVTVKGRANPVAIIEKLTNAIIALGSNI